MDTLSSDGGLVEHDPTRPENNFGPSDYDRTHRLTTSFMLDVPGARRGRVVRARADRRLEPVGHLHLPVGHAVLGASATPTRNAFFAQVEPRRASASRRA